MQIIQLTSKNECLCQLVVKLQIKLVKQLLNVPIHEKKYYADKNLLLINVINGHPLQLAACPSGSYYDPANKGLPSVVGGAVLELDVIVDGFKTILDTGLLLLLELDHS